MPATDQVHYELVISNKLYTILVPCNVRRLAILQKYFVFSWHRPNQSKNHGVNNQQLTTLYKVHKMLWSNWHESHHGADPMHTYYVPNVSSTQAKRNQKKNCTTMCNFVPERALQYVCYMILNDLWHEIQFY